MPEMIQAIYVEDEPTIRELLPTALGLRGINVTMIYRSAEELLAQKETAVYQEADIFILDVRLPGISGLELARKLRDDGEKRPIVAVSAWPLPPGIDLEKIEVEYMRKPFDYIELEEVIQRLTGKQSSE